MGSEALKRFPKGLYLVMFLTVVSGIGAIITSRLLRPSLPAVPTVAPILLG